MSETRPQNPVPGRIFCVDSESEVTIDGFQRPGTKNKEKLITTIYSLFHFFFFVLFKPVHQMFDQIFGQVFDQGFLASQNTVYSSTGTEKYSARYYWDGKFRKKKKHLRKILMHPYKII